MRTPTRLVLLSALLAAGALGCQDEAPSEPSTQARIDALRDRVDDLGVTTPDPGPLRSPGDPLVELGRALFFDPLLSGNQDIACATCHHPAFGTGDGLPISVGVGGEGGIGPGRERGRGRVFVPRNAPELFNRGSASWNTMFWDARVSIDYEPGVDGFHNPIDQQLPEGLDSVLAVQAMFPVTSRDEMLGEVGENEIADAVDAAAPDPLGDDPVDELEVWSRLADRLRAEPAYVEMFLDTYPDLEVEDIEFVHAANAMAAFMVSEFTMLDTPFDRFIAGDDQALDEAALRGAELFFGQADCVGCHSGPLLTDQRAWALCAPQLGPGKGVRAPTDLGRFLDSNHVADRFAFRTPPLRNVAITGPYMHSGAYATLEDAVRHHVDPAGMLERYTGDHLPLAMQAMIVRDDAMIAEMERRMPADRLAPLSTLTDEQIDDIVAFLEALTDPAAVDLDHVIPDSVPSGLEVPRVE